MSDTEPTERLYVSLALIGKDLIPEEVTSKLGIQPQHSFRCGDYFEVEDKGKKVRKHGFWEISSDDQVLPSGDIVAQFNWLLNLIEPVKDELRQILEDKSIKARMSCFWIVPDGRINIEIEPEFISRLASLNLRIWFDIYSNES